MKLLVTPLLLVPLAVGVYALRTPKSSQEVDPADAITATGVRVWYAASDAASTGDGRKTTPLDLTTALGPKSPVRPGDTLWIRGGTYRGIFASYLNGTAEAPITLAPYPGEHVIIDGAPEREPALAVMGAWTVVTGLEIMNSDPIRRSSGTGSSPADQRRGMGVEVRGAHAKIVNMVVHDMAGGLGMWSDAIGSEAHGNIVYYNGWQAPDRNHGHGIYSQNQTEVRKIEDNIIFSQIGYGVHIYGSEEAYLDNINLEGNVIFNNGVINDKDYERNILFGGGRPAQNAVIRKNFTYYSPNMEPGSSSSRGKRWGGENNIGYIGGCTNMLMEDNYFVHWGGGEALILTKCTGTIRNNFIFGLTSGDIRVPETFPDNTYVMAPPPGVKVFVRPNHYQPGRAHIVIYNWEHRDEVAVDLSNAGLQQGQPFEIRDVQNFFASPVVTGTFDGSKVTVPMTGLTTARPVGATMKAPPHTAPEFGAFVVLPASPSQSFWQRWFSRFR